MAVQEVTRLLRIFIESEEELDRRYGPDAVPVAEDIQQMVKERLRQESAYNALWDAFERDPEAHEAELTGALEAMVEADPALARRMDSFLGEFHEAMATPAATGGIEVETANTAETPTGGEEPPALGSEDRRASTPVVREPYYPDTATLVEHESVVGDGTYLYGNVKGGKAPVGREIGVDVFDFGERVQAVQVANLSGLPDFFDEIFAAVEEVPDVDLDQRIKVKEDLQVLKDEVLKGEAADQQRLTEQLQALKDRAPDVAGAILRALDTLDLAPPIEQAVNNVRDDTP